MTKYLEKKLEREIKARRMAEEILEQKSQEIYHMNVALKELNKELKIALDFKSSALKESEIERFELFENAIVGIALSYENVILKVNNTFANLLGYEIDEVIGLSVTCLSYKEDIEASIQHSNLLYNNKQQSFTIKKRYKRKNGSFFWANAHVSKVKDNNNKTKYHLIIIENINNQMIAEHRSKVLVNQLREINESLENFAHIVSHDLKAPLTGINTILSWMENIVMNEQMKEYHQLMLDRVDKMYHLIDAVIAYSRVSNTKEAKENFNSHQIIEETIQFLHVPHHIKIKISGDFPIIRMNKAKFSQIINNLISNAVKFNNKPVGIIEIKYEKDTTFHIFKVWDNGIGIDSKYYSKIFTMFNSIIPDKRNNGLGLSLVKKIIEQHKGKITVQSEVNNYTEFTFSLNIKTLTHD